MASILAYVSLTSSAEVDRCLFEARRRVNFWRRSRNTFIWDLGQRVGGHSCRLGSSLSCRRHLLRIGRDSGRRGLLLGQRVHGGRELRSGRLRRRLGDCLPGICGWQSVCQCLIRWLALCGNRRRSLPAIRRLRGRWKGRLVSGSRRISAAVCYSLWLLRTSGIRQRTQIVPGCRFGSHGGWEPLDSCGQLGLLSEDLLRDGSLLELNDRSSCATSGVLGFEVEIHDLVVSHSQFPELLAQLLQ
mmetsp:Transcript_1132/g.2165  ORF Transcript_1132/g.2165 Transcript_1132/m.2165 type:complete len:244 (-) Transcript_1132:526-1257(-)